MTLAEQFAFAHSPLPFRASASGNRERSPYKRPFNFQFEISGKRGKRAPMKSSEIFAHLSPALCEQVLGWLHATEKPTYKVAVQTLATQRKLRPIFVERKPRAERHAWMQGALSRPASETIAANLLQMWLMGSQAPLLCDFLDALGIEHDEHGGIDSLPETPASDNLHAAVETLLAKYPAEIVAVYLQSFQTMDIAGWPALGEMLAQDARLHLPAATPAPALTETPAHG